MKYFFTKFAYQYCFGAISSKDKELLCDIHYYCLLDNLSDIEVGDEIIRTSPFALKRIEISNKQALAKLLILHNISVDILKKL